MNTLRSAASRDPADLRPTVFGDPARGIVSARGDLA